METKTTKDQIPHSTVTRNLNQFSKPTGNIYESVVVMSRRANQIAVEQKQELDAQLQEFSTYTEASEEYVENTEQVELSRRYEKMPKPVLIAAYEFEHGEVYFRNPAKEEQEEQPLI